MGTPAMLAMKASTFLGPHQLFVCTGGVWKVFPKQPAWGAWAAPTGSVIGVTPAGLSTGVIIIKVDARNYAHYDPNTGTWSTISAADLGTFRGTYLGPTAGSRFAAVTSDDHVFVLSDVNLVAGGWAANAVSHWDGSSWSYVTGSLDNINNGPGGIAATSTTDVWVSATLELWNWNGSTWTNHFSTLQGIIGAGITLSNICSIGTNVYVCGSTGVGDNGFIAKYIPGSGWSQLGATTPIKAFYIWGYSENSLCVFGCDSVSDQLWRYNPSGGTWSLQYTVTPPDWLHNSGTVEGSLLWGLSDTEMWACRKYLDSLWDNTLYHSVDGGVNWTAESWVGTVGLDGLGSGFFDPIVTSSENVDITETVTVKVSYGYSRSRAETVDLTETTSLAKSYEIVQNETVDLTETAHAAGAYNYEIVENETVDLTEGHQAEVFGYVPLSPQPPPSTIGLVQATLTNQARYYIARGLTDGTMLKPYRFVLGTGWEDPRWGERHQPGPDSTDVVDVVWEGLRDDGKLWLEKANLTTLSIRLAGPQAMATEISEAMIYARIHHSPFDNENGREIAFAVVTFPSWFHATGQQFVLRFVMPL